MILYKITQKEITVDKLVLEIKILYKTIFNKTFNLKIINIVTIKIFKE